MPMAAKREGEMRREVDAVEQDAAAAWPQHAGDHVEQRGLAGAVRADHAADFARRHVKADIGDRLQAAKTLAEIFDREQGGHDSHRLAPLVMLDVAQALAPRIGDAEIEFLHVLVGGELLRGAVEDDAAGLQDVAVVGDIERALRVLLDQQHRHLHLVAQLCDHLIDPVDDQRREAQRRLVERQQHADRVISARPIASICCSPPDM